MPNPEADRQGAEMPHIRIHRFRAGEGKEGSTEHGKPDWRRRLRQVYQRVMRAEGTEHAGRIDDPAEAEHTNDHEPQQHHRSEDVTDECSTLTLDQKQADQDRDADRNHDGREPGSVKLQALDGTQHRDGRCDDPIAIEQSGPDQTDDHQRGPPTAARRIPDVEQGQERHDAAFAAVVGAHDQNGVFERNNQNQRPQNDGHDAHDGFGRDRSCRIRGLFEPVKRAGANVAVDDAERRQSGSGG